MDNGVLISLITGVVTIIVAWLTTRNKASKAEVDGLRADLENCKEQNAKEREAEKKTREENTDRERAIREEIANKLKTSIDENNELRKRNEELQDENITLMKKYIMKDTAPKIRKR